MSDAGAPPWPKRIGAITLFTEDLAASRDFYGAVFGVPLIFEDADSAAFDFGNLIVNVLRAGAAHELIEPAAVGAPDAGPRVQLTIDVDDVDGVCADLARLHVALLNGPLDRPWGVRTATFRDLGGHVWEIAQPIRRPS